MPNINLNYKLVTDIKNNFFTNNRFIAAESLPAEGDFVKGDLIVNIGENANDEAMWLCVESGNPGVWEVVGAGAGGGSSKIVTLKSRVTVNNALSEVNIGISGFNKATDTLIVFNNARFMVEGVDYEINADSTKIVAMNGNAWNEELANDFVFDFVIFKMMNVNENGDVIVSSANEIVKLKNNVVVNEAVNEVEIGIDGFNEGDDLTVYKNSVYMMEGIDYEINVDSRKIILNEACAVGSIFAFEVIKTVAKINPDAVVGMEHLNEDVREAIEAAGNIDLSGYATKEEMNGKVAQGDYDTKIAELEGRVEEAFTSANNGKQLIASAIGNPLITGNSTFSAMSEAILGLRRNTDNETDAREVLYNMMIEDGYNEATSEMTVDELIALLDDSNIDVGDIKQIACGEYHTFILKNDGSVWSCGNNEDSQLGLGDIIDRTTFTQVTININNDVKQISCGSGHTFILKNDGSVWGCGRNSNGQLGLGDTTSRTTFTQVTTNVNSDVKQIVCGGYHTIILKNDGSVWSCGSNDKGQLGLGDIIDRTTFTQVTININNDVKQIACGHRHTFILKNDGSVYSCGYNYRGQLGINNTTTDRTAFTQVTTNINNDVKQISCGFQHTFILKNDGSVWSCGYNDGGQLGLNDINQRNTFTQVTTNINNDVKQISCGGTHTFISKNDGSLWSCGVNINGQLGLGDNTIRYSFTQVITNINNDVKQISCGGYHTFILKNDSSIWSCGYNAKGQLGLGDATNRDTFTNTNFYIPITDYEINRQKLYYYLLSNDIEVTESMDIGTMLDLLVDDYINNMILGYENNLRVILTDEGVSVNNEDNMDSLITKVDEEFNRQVVPAGDAVAANVLTGKTFINSTGQLVTGTMPQLTSNIANTTTNAPKHYQTDKVTVKDLSGLGGICTYFQVPTNTNTGNIQWVMSYTPDLIAANIVSGKSILGVTGTATKVKTVSASDNVLFSLGPSDALTYGSGIIFKATNKDTWLSVGTVTSPGTGTVRVKTTVTINNSSYKHKVVFIQTRNGSEVARSSEFEITYSSSTTTSYSKYPTCSYDFTVQYGDKIEMKIKPNNNGDNNNNSINVYYYSLCGNLS